MGAIAQAQDRKAQIKVNPVVMPLSKNVALTNSVREQLPAVTGIFLMKYTRVKRALSFTITQKDVKLA